MKKTIIFFIGIITFTTSFCQEVFIYNENGTPYYFNENPNVKYVEFSNNLSDNDFEAAKTALFQYADTIQNLEYRLFRLYVGTPSFDQLPKNALSYLAEIEKAAHTPVKAVSISPDRKDVLFR